MYQLDQHTFANKAVLVRVDFNVPLNEKFEVTDNTRIRAAVKTILKLSSDGAKVILMSHLGRPKGGPEDKFSLKHIQQEVSNVLGKPVAFAGNCVGEEAKHAVEKMKAGDILLLENLRFYKEEEGGDELGPGGKVIRKREDVLKEYYDTAQGVADQTPVRKAKTVTETASEEEWVEDDEGNFVPADEVKVTKRGR